MSRYTTLIAGRHARTVFRNEARILELVQRLTDQTRHPDLVLWVAWIVIDADKTMSDEEALLLKHLVRLAKDRHCVIDGQVAQSLRLISTRSGGAPTPKKANLRDLVDLAHRVGSMRWTAQ